MPGVEREAAGAVPNRALFSGARALNSPSKYGFGPERGLERVRAYYHRNQAKEAGPEKREKNKAGVCVRWIYRTTHTHTLRVHRHTHTVHKHIHTFRKKSKSVWWICRMTQTH